MSKARAKAAARTQPSASKTQALTQYFQSGQLSQAERLARQFSEQYPRFGFGWKVLGAIELQKNNCAQALQASLRAAALSSGDAAIHNNIASALIGLDRLDEAEQQLSQALAIAPNYAMAIGSLGNIWRLRKNYPLAENYLYQSIALNPAQSSNYFRLGNVLELQNKIHQAQIVYRQGLAISPDQIMVCSDALHLMSLDDQVSPAELHAQHLKFGELIESDLHSQWRAHSNRKDPARRLKVGLVAADLFDHALANYFEPTLRYLARLSGLSLYVYYNNTVVDAITHRMRACLPEWHAVAGLDDEALTNKIRQHEIDILIDLNGHTVKNRLRVFARKPAPIQLSWLGYLGSTGIQAMDYYLADPYWIKPTAMEWQFTEKIAYLPCAAIFEPNQNAPQVNELPAVKNAYITFGSFNRQNKINDSVVAAWSELLTLVPSAKLVIGAVAEDYQDSMRQKFVQAGVAAERLKFLPRSLQVDYLCLHHQIDFCLDTFPFGGGATTAHAAWMGVPTLCLAGSTPGSRFGAAEMHHLGLDQFIADSPAQYLELAQYWAHHTADLATIRAHLRERFSASPLGQFQTFANQFEALLRSLWQRWCRGQPAAHFTLDAPACKSAASAPFEPTMLQKDELKTLYDQHRYQEAQKVARQMIADFPEHAMARKYLGGILHELGKFSESLALQRETARLLADDFEAHFNLANELHHQGFLDDAVASYVCAMNLRPNDPNPYNNISIILIAMGLNAQAESYSREAIKLFPAMASAHNNLGNALKAQGKYREAKLCYFKALELKPDWPEAINNMAITLKDSGAEADAITYYKKALTLKPDWAPVQSNLIFCYSLNVNIPATELYAEHIAFGEKYELPLEAERKPHANSKQPNRVLNIGFVSGDLFDHALANFYEPVFECLSKQADLVLHAYYTYIYDDSVTQRMKSYFAKWNLLPAMSESDLAECIRSDGIDILFDLSGHTANNRLLTFARKPAPIQISWIGYLGSTGIKAIDYYLCDQFWIPPGQLDWQFVEKPAYLPAAMVFKPSQLAPSVNDLPALKNGYVTLGSFNRSNKINDSVIVLWSMLLQRLPTAKMVLGGMHEESQDQILKSFMQAGIAAERLRFENRSNLQNYLALHQQIDFCLDTFPFGGGATTAHAAWMGVPTLSLAGETPASRFGATLMHHLSLDDFVATSIEDYLAKACFWAEHLKKLQSIRQNIREVFSKSGIGKFEEFSRNLNALLREMWQRWCRGDEVSMLDLPKPSSSPTGC